jgi:hypothetical protein
MQQYPHPYPQNVPAAPALHRTQRKLAPAIKFTGARSTSSVWGGSTVYPDRYDDDDNDTVAAYSIASSQSRMPGNRPLQQRRVEHWVKDTKDHAPEFRSPFAPRSGETTPTSTSVRSKAHAHHHHHHSSRREPPPVWVPQQPMQSQPVLGMQAPPVQYTQPQYAQPQVVWVPASQVQAPPHSHHPQMPFGVAKTIPYVPPAMSSSAVR